MVRLPAVPAAGGTSEAAAPAQVRVDLDAIRANVSALRAVARDADVLAVVKADGYGHGLLPVARAARDGGAGWLGVALLEEALALRRAGDEGPVLAWLFSPQQPLGPAVAAGIDLGVSAPWALAAAAAAAVETGVPARLHLKADTGLSRAGATPADWPALCVGAARAVADGTVEVVGVWSHFAYADEPGHPTVRRQTAVFAEALTVAAGAGLRPSVRHLANSAATLTSPGTHYDLVRPGLAVYGLSPVPQIGGPAAYGLRPAMTMTARVVLAKRVPAGSGVSYGHRYTTDRETGLALVPVGYADGVPRAATNIAEVLVAGRRRRIAGTVCMDQFVVDVGADAVSAGDEVVLFGPGDRGEPTAQDWADALGTISYEIVTRIGPRVPRTYAGPPR